MDKVSYILMKLPVGGLAPPLPVFVTYPIVSCWVYGDNIWIFCCEVCILENEVETTVDRYIENIWRKYKISLS